MTPEREQLQWGAHSVSEGPAAEILVHASHKKIRLDEVQTPLLRGLKEAGTVEALVLKELAQGRLVSFAALHDLMRTLSAEGVVINKSWGQLWSDRIAGEKAKELNHSGSQVLVDQLEALPVFHGLDKDTLGFLAGLAQSYRCPPNTRLITQGQGTRDLFVLLTGEAGVYAQIDGKPRRFIAKLVAPALFGEAGFLLGKPRTADVVTSDTCQVIRISHKPEVDERIRDGKAENLQRRFWVLHALSASEIFQGLPLEAWDDVALLGSLKTLKNGETLFLEGSQGSSFYILVQGQLTVWQNGKQINHMGQGSCLGEIALLASRGLRTASVRAEGECLVQEIPAQQFYPLLARNLPLAKELEQLARLRVGRDQIRR